MSLRENERREDTRWRTLFDSMSEGVALHELIRDDQGRPVDYLIVDTNPAFETILGITRETCIGVPATQVYQSQLPPYFEEYRAVVASGTARRMETYFASQARHFAISITPWGDDGFATIFSDITERKRMEQVLLFLAQTSTGSSEEDFFHHLARFLSECLDMEFICIDILEEGNLSARTLAVYCDGKFEDNVSYTLKDTPCGEVVDKKVCCYQEGVRHLFKDDAVLQDLLAESYVGTVLWSSDGRPIGLIAVIGRRPLAHPELARKILQVVGVRAAAELESRLHEQALQERKQLLRTIIDMIPACIAYVGPDLRYRMNNRNYQEWFGHSPEWLLGRPVREVIGKEAWAMAWPYIQRVLAGEVVSFDHTIPSTGDGIRWVHATLVPFMDATGRQSGYVTHVTDITGIREASEELRLAKEAAEAASLTKSRFLANMSHELRTPMNGALGMIQLALLGTMSNEQRNYLETASEAGKGLVRILNDILDLTKAESGKLTIMHEPFALRAAVAEVLRILDLEAKRKGLTLTGEIAHNVPEQVVGDRLRLQQVLTNLVANAVKFTEQGTVVVTVAAVAESAGRANVSFEVADTGVGIPAGKEQLLFQPFSQVDDSITRRHGGTGLGLVICKEIVGRLDGSITCTSEEGRGSVFTVTIPFETTEPATAPVVHAPEKTVVAVAGAASQAERLPRILVAEDDPVNRTTLQIILKRSGFQPELAPNGQRAVEMWEQGGYDLIIMDVQMPVMNGIKAAETIRRQEQQHDGHIPILALTAHAYQDDISACLDAGMDAYLAKPVDLNEMLEKIREMLET